MDKLIMSVSKPCAAFRNLSLTLTLSPHFQQMRRKMKIKINGKNSNSKAKVKRKYPYAGLHSNGMIIIFYHERAGFIINGANKGLHSTSWLESDFIPIKSKLTLTLEK